MSRNEPTIERYQDHERAGITCKLHIPDSYIEDNSMGFWRLRIAYWLVRMVFGKLGKP